MTQHTHTPHTIQKKIRGPYISLAAFDLLNIMAKNRTCNPLDLVAYAIKKIVSDIEAVHLASELGRIEVPAHIERQPSDIPPVTPKPLTGGPQKSSAKAVRKGKRLGNMPSPVALTIDYMAQFRKWGKGQLIQYALEYVATSEELQQWEATKPGANLKVELSQTSLKTLQQWEATKAPTDPAPSTEPVL